MKRLIFSFVAFLAASSAFALELGSPFVDLPLGALVASLALYGTLGWFSRRNAN